MTAPFQIMMYAQNGDVIKQEACVTFRHALDEMLGWLTEGLDDYKMVIEEEGEVILVYDNSGVKL